MGDAQTMLGTTVGWMSGLKSLVRYYNRSSRLYGGRLCCQARQEEVLAELQGGRARLRCVLIRLAKGV